MKRISREELQEIYFLNHFRDLDRKLNTLNLFRLQMNFGKTYSIFNTAVPYLIENDGTKVHLYLAPQTQLLDKSIDTYLAKSMKGKSYKVIREIESLIDLKIDIETYDYVFIVMTDALFNERLKDSRFMTYFKSFGKELVVFRDEAHYGASSSSKTYKGNTGNLPVNYTASTFKRLNGLSKITPHMYFFTATTVKEQEEELFGVGNYNIVNPTPQKEQLVEYQSWLGETRPINLNGSLKEQLSKTITYHLDRMNSASEYINFEFPQTFDRLFNYNRKMTMMYRCETEWLDKKGRWTVDNCIKTMKSIELPESIHYCKNNKDGIFEYDNNHKLLGTLTQPEWLYRMNDDDDPLTITFVCNLGVMGINISNLTTAVVLRDTKTEFEGTPVTHTTVQFLGRFNRLYLPISGTDFKKYFDGDIVEMLKQLHPDGNVDKALKLLQYYNTHNVFYPKTDNWIDTMGRYETDYANNWEKAVQIIRNWIDNKEVIGLGKPYSRKEALKEAETTPEIV
tara:strand:+ start:3157 stop:4683 length:1527 start_codon:yes stop_codon:yes gene_type:complete